MSEKSNLKQNLQKSTIFISSQNLCDQSGEFAGYASVFGNRDSHGDVVQKGAFLNSIATCKTKPLLWQHNPDTPIGVINQISEDEYGLLICGKFLLDVEKAREAYALVKNNAISGLSIGYTPVISSKIPGGRLLKEINLMEVSLVTFASNSLAKITEIKNINNINNMQLKIKNLINNIKNF